MKITIDRKTFADALSEVAPFAPQKSPLMILKYAKITTKANRMKIEANDTNCGIAKYIDTLECDQDGSFLVEIADLYKFVAKTEGNTIEIETDGTAVKLKHSKGKAEFASQEAEQYPSFKKTEGDALELSLPAAALSEAVSKAKSFVGNDDFRPTMKTIYAYVKDGRFGYCATDTIVMIADSTAVPVPEGTDTHWYIEPAAFSAIAKGCRGIDSATVKIADTTVCYRLGDTVITTTQTKGNYPDFNRVIPKQWSFECRIGRKDLIESIVRVGMFAGDSNLIKLAFSRMDLSVSSSNIENMRSSVESLTHNGCGGEAVIGFKAEALQRCLAVCDEEEACLCLTDSSRPMLIKQDGRPNQTQLLMPMKIND